MECIRDARKKRLVPMCPDRFLNITETSNAGERHISIRLLNRTIRLVEKEWTLYPSKSGKEIKYTLYQPTAEQVDETCTICLEKLVSDEKKKDKKGKQRMSLQDSDDRPKSQELDESSDEPAPVQTGSSKVPALTLICGHSFHLDCVTSLMLNEGPVSYKCPLCKKTMLFAEFPGESAPPNETDNSCSNCVFHATIVEVLEDDSSDVDLYRCFGSKVFKVNPEVGDIVVIGNTRQ